jgi:hypothetical protein
MHIMKVENHFLIWAALLGARREQPDGDLPAQRAMGGGGGAGAGAGDGPGFIIEMTHESGEQTRSMSTLTVTTTTVVPSSAAAAVTAAEDAAEDAQREVASDVAQEQRHHVEEVDDLIPPPSGDAPESARDSTLPQMAPSPSPSREVRKLSKKQSMEDFWMESIKRSPEHLSAKTQSLRRGNTIRQDSLRTLREFKKVQGGISGWEVSAMQGGPDDEEIASLLRRVQSTSAGADGGPASSRLGLGDAADEQQVADNMSEVSRDSLDDRRIWDMIIRRLPPAIHEADFSEWFHDIASKLTAEHVDNALSHGKRMMNAG